MTELDLSGIDLYGIRALRYVEQHCPTRFATISDPVSFFSALGEQINVQVLELEEALAGPAPAGETWIDGVGRRNMARMNAVEAVFSEMVYQAMPPEDSTTDDPGWEPLIPLETYQEAAN